MPEPSRRSTEETLAALFAAGRRVVAVAAKPAPELTTLTADDECDLCSPGSWSSPTNPNPLHANRCPNWPTWGSS